MTRELYRPPASDALGPRPFVDQSDRVRRLAQVVRLFAWASIAALVVESLFVVVAVVLMRALVVAHRNSERISGAPLAHSATSTVFWWFVPIANFFVPFRRVRGIWRSSTAPGLEPVVPSKAIGIWKQAWIAAVVFAPLMTSGTGSWAVGKLAIGYMMITVAARQAATTCGELAALQAATWSELRTR